MDLSTQPTLVLIGDSTLDNVLWVTSPSSCIACQLRAAGFNVLNYAADGFTSDDVLNGGKPLLSRAARESAGDSLPGWGTDAEESSLMLFEPLKHVEDLVRKSGGNGSMPITVVLSVGGNDIRHILKDMKAVESTVKRLHSNFAALLDRLLLLRPVVNTVICMQYRPCMSEGNSPRKLIQTLSLASHKNLLPPTSALFVSHCIHCLLPQGSTRSIMAFTPRWPSCQGLKVLCPNSIC